MCIAYLHVAKLSPGNNLKKCYVFVLATRETSKITLLEV